MGVEAIPRTIQVLDDRQSVRIVDQTQLPETMAMVELMTVEGLVDAVKRLAVRGAPALGVAGAAGVALAAATKCRRGTAEQFIEDLRPWVDVVANARPTAVNLSWGAWRVYEAVVDSVIDRSRSTSDYNVTKEAIDVAFGCAIAIQHDDEASCRAIGRNGAALLKPNSRVLTHCNAGSLATAFYGTALGVVYAAHEQGKIAQVYADETRPVGQGARLTAWELSRAGVPTTLICDNMSASLMAQGMVDAVVVGADRICANGDFANKIGTYGVAVNARYHGIPFYVAAPMVTFDFGTACGSDIVIEQRDAAEFGYPVIEGVERWNPAFDVTPHDLVTAFITDEGVVRPEDELFKKGSL